MRKASRNQEFSRKKVVRLGRRAERLLSVLLLRAHRATKKVPTEVVGAIYPNQEYVASHEREVQCLHRTFGRLATALSAREKEKLHFLASAVHDLKSPLMIVGGAARQLCHKDMTETERDDWLDSLIRNATTLETLVADLLAEARQESYQAARWEPVNLHDLARDLVRHFDAIPSTHVLNFSGDKTTDCWITGNPEALRRLLFNLISNAMKSSEAGRDVCVSVWRRPSSVVLAVEDDGKDVPISKTERMFLPFMPLERTSLLNDGHKTELSVANCIAQLHGAEICVQGAQESGRTYQVCFPVQDR